MAIYQLGDKKPVIPASCFVAESATIIGDVTLGERVSVLFGAVLRGDNEPITIGDDSNVQDNCVLHNDPGAPLIIGKGVTIGHCAMLHGCIIGDGALIGIQAVVLNSTRHCHRAQELPRPLDDPRRAGQGGARGHRRQHRAHAHGHAGLRPSRRHVQREAEAHWLTP